MVSASTTSITSSKVTRPSSRPVIVHHRHAGKVVARHQTGDFFLVQVRRHRDVGVGHERTYRPFGPADHQILERQDARPACRPRPPRTPGRSPPPPPPAAGSLPAPAPRWPCRGRSPRGWSSGRRRSPRRSGGAGLPRPGRAPPERICSCCLLIELAQDVGCVVVLQLLDDLRGLLRDRAPPGSRSACASSGISASAWLESSAGSACTTARRSSSSSAASTSARSAGSKSCARRTKTRDLALAHQVDHPLEQLRS